MHPTGESHRYVHYFQTPGILTHSNLNRDDNYIFSQHSAKKAAVSKLAPLGDVTSTLDPKTVGSDRKPQKVTGNKVATYITFRLL